MIRGKVHAGSNHGDPAREVRQSGLTTGSFVRSAGVLTGPALLSAPLRGCNQRTPREGYTHGANGVLQVPDGRRSWPPGPHLVPNWGRRDRPFQPLGLGGLRFPHTYPSCIHPISLAWLSSTCGVQGSCVHLQLYERQVDNLRKLPEKGSILASIAAIAARIAINRSVSTSFRPLLEAAFHYQLAHTQTLCTILRSGLCDCIGVYGEWVHAGEPPGHPAQKLKKPTRSLQLGTKYGPGGHGRRPYGTCSTPLAP